MTLFEENPLSLLLLLVSFIAFVGTVLWTVGLIFFTKQAIGKVVRVERDFSYESDHHSFVMIVNFSALNGKTYQSEVRSRFGNENSVGQNWFIRYWPSNPEISEGRSLAYWFFLSTILGAVFLAFVDRILG